MRLRQAYERNKLRFRLLGGDKDRGSIGCQFLGGVK